MTYSIQMERYKILFSDNNFKYCRKKPTISVYDPIENIETKVASFNSQEMFEWFIRLFTNTEEPT